MTFAVEAHEQGAAAGLTSSIGGIGFIIGPALGTGLYGLNMLAPFWFAAAVLILGLALLIMHPLTRIRKSPQIA
jgi:MFS family permease